MKTITNWFFKPTAADIAKEELEEAKRQYMLAQSNVEYHSSMVIYHRARIARLKQTLAAEKD